MAEVNFLCVHKKLRSKRLAPVLIKEVTRRVNLRGIFQAAYTAGVLLPKPVSACRYFHRSLNPRKLLDSKFTSLAPRMTVPRTEKLYRVDEVGGGWGGFWCPVLRGELPTACAVSRVPCSVVVQHTKLPGLRPMTPADVPQAFALYRAYMRRCGPLLIEAEATHVPARSASPPARCSATLFLLPHPFVPPNPIQQVPAAPRVL